MTYSEAKIQAYEKLEEAIENLRKVYIDEDPDDDGAAILTGWLLLTSAIEFSSGHAEECEHHDELDSRNVAGWFSKRGQNPVMSLGMMHNAIHHFNAINDG
jgi:hypothetical protein